MVLKSKNTMEKIKEINTTILELNKNGGDEVENISDGYHTFKELYEFRKVYNATLFNEWAKLRDNPYNVHKSWKHNDGEWCFGNKKEWFIVVAKLPSGLISNHYPASDWDLFNIPEVEKAIYEYDGHVPADVIIRLKDLNEKLVNKKYDNN